MALSRERVAALERWSWDLTGDVSNDVLPPDRLEMQELVKAGSEAANLQFHADMLKAEVERLEAALAAAVEERQRASLREESWRAAAGWVVRDAEYRDGLAKFPALMRVDRVAIGSLKAMLKNTTAAAYAGEPTSTQTEREATSGEG